MGLKKRIVLKLLYRGHEHYRAIEKCFQADNTVETLIKKDLNLKIHRSTFKIFFADQFSNSVHKSFLGQTILNLRKKQDQKY